MTRWWDPRDWVNGERITSPLLNKYVRDAFRSTWHEVSYTEFTAPVNATAGGADVVSSGASTYLPYPTVAEFYAPGCDTAVKLHLHDGATDLGILAFVSVAGLREIVIDVEREFTPTAGSHTFKVVAYGSAGSVQAGAGGSGVLFPGHLRILQRGPV